MIYPISTYQIGDVLTVPCELAGERYIHYGFADGFGRVIHGSKRKLVFLEESEAEFSGGKPIQVCAEITSADGKRIAYERARSFIGNPYNVITDNCEHFVRWAHGLEKESRQIQKYGLVATGGIVVASSRNPVMLGAAAGGAIGAYCTPEGESPEGYTMLGMAIGALLIAALK